MENKWDDIEELLLAEIKDAVEAHNKENAFSWIDTLQHFETARQIAESGYDDEDIN